MNIQFVTKRVDGVYEVAVIVDGKFKRSGSGPDVLALLQRLCGPIIAPLNHDGTEVSVVLTVLTELEVMREADKEARARQTQEAEAEAVEIEKLTAAINRELEARKAFRDDRSDS